MSRAGILEEAFEIYKRNLVLVVPPVAALIGVVLLVVVVVLALLPIGLAWLTAGKISLLASLLVGAPLIALAVLLAACIVVSVSLGALARMSVRASRGERAELEEGFGYALGRIGTFFPLGLVLAVAALALSVVPYVGRAVVFTALSPSFILAVLGASVSEALEESVRLMVRALDSRPEVPIVVFVVYLLTSVQRLGILVWILGVPYAFVLIAHYVVNELGWSPRSRP